MWGGLERSLRPPRVVLRSKSSFNVGRTAVESHHTHVDVDGDEYECGRI